MAWKLPPPPPPDSQEFCTCARPVSVSGSYCATCGKKLRAGGALPPPPGPPATVQTPYPGVVKPVMKPVTAAPAHAQPAAKPAPAMHPLEQRFMAHMMGQPVPPLKPAAQPAPPQTMPSLNLASPIAPAAGITPPSAFPTFTPSAPPPQKPVHPPAASAPPAMSMPRLDLASPIASPRSSPPPTFPPSPSRLPTAAPGMDQSFSLPSSPPAQAAPTAAPVEAHADLNLGFDIGDAEADIAPEQMKTFEFEAIMDRFKTVITTEQKMLAYDFADKIGVTDYIEDFYDYLANPDKDGIISYKGDEVKINKTKIMGALMLGDNSMLDRAMTGFRAWLTKVMK